MKLIVACIAVVALASGAACSSSSDDSDAEDTLGAVQVEVDPEVVDELVVICTETQDEFDDLTGDVGDAQQFVDNSEAIMAVLDERIERLEEVDAGAAAGELSGVIAGYEEHREITQDVVDAAGENDIDAATAAVLEGSTALSDINRGWARLGANACAVEVS